MPRLSTQQHPSSLKCLGAGPCRYCRNLGCHQKIASTIIDVASVEGSSAFGLQSSAERLHGFKVPWRDAWLIFGPSFGAFLGCGRLLAWEAPLKPQNLRGPRA